MGIWPLLSNSNILCPWLVTTHVKNETITGIPSEAFCSHFLFREVMVFLGCWESLFGKSTTKFMTQANRARAAIPSPNAEGKSVEWLYDTTRIQVQVPGIVLVRNPEKWSANEHILKPQVPPVVVVVVVLVVINCSLPCVLLVTEYIYSNFIAAPQNWQGLIGLRSFLVIMGEGVVS